MKIIKQIVFSLAFSGWITATAVTTGILSQLICIYFTTLENWEKM